ncbi:MAG: hypothetical protein WCO56_00855 [Verrucomicrobiota bacterium]
MSHSPDSESNFSRRNFLQRGAQSATALALGTATPSVLAAKATEENPYEYKIDQYLKTDPALVHYEAVAQFNCPGQDARRIALGANDQAFISAGRTVYAVDAGGHVAREYQAADVVRALAVDKDGGLFLGLKEQVEVFGSAGKSMGVWQSPGPKTWLTGIAVGEQDVYAADAGNRVIHRYDKSGKPSGRLGEKDKDRNIPGLILPSPFCDVEIGRDGLVRVTNSGRHQVETYNAKGDLEFAWGEPGVGIKHFCGCCNPINIALLSDGRVVTCEKGLLRVKIYSDRGEFQSVVAGTESFPKNATATMGQGKWDGSMAGLDAAVDSLGRVWILDQVGKTIKIMARKKAAA